MWGKDGEHNQGMVLSQYYDGSVGMMLTIRIFVVLYSSYATLSHILSNLSLKLAPLGRCYYVSLYNKAQRA